MLKDSPKGFLKDCLKESIKAFRKEFLKDALVYLAAGMPAMWEASGAD